ncbi:MAG: bifunctional 4-hydroxy-2-oxoglutarate aldolase/2-dehydro-3-deoxy-phosphogluconate aldolase [Deltaproteobacteria bacterium]|nr:bifunctional 4-hydroxy-2-oxoglutarate aldolase/2-dehydro-3-deoxy-phosphogluconate aldolase [Deltaproteobacteria bacterium]
MEKSEVLERIRTVGLIPVVRLSTSQDAMEVADALREGGASLIEITMTVPGALDVIRDLSLRYGSEILVGAGTVLDAETGRAAILSGAQFLVSPAIDLGLIQLANRSNVLAIPGAMTPTEILTSWNAGADMVKVFPVAQLGGAGYIKALRGPLPHIPLVPTGGVNLQNAASFIRAGAAALGAGGELVDKRLVREKKFHLIRDNTEAFLNAVRDARQVE